MIENVRTDHDCRAIKRGLFSAGAEGYMENEPGLEVSPLSRLISSGGRTVDVQIYRFVGETSWILEVEDEYGNSTVWDDAFASDSAALVEAKKSILSEGVTAFIGPENGKGEWK